MKIRASERGQAMVLITLAIIAMLGFAALAIDGGLLYSERAGAQNAADSAAFAAAIAGARGGDYVAAARNLAKLNGLDDDSASVDVEVTQTVNGNEQFYRVAIRSEYRPYFAQIVYTGKLENRVEAVTRIVINGPSWLGSGLVATSPNACQAMCMGGNIAFTSEKGHAFANSNKVGNNTANPCHSMAAHGNVNLHFTQGSSLITVGSYYKFGGSGSVVLDPPGSIQQNQSPLGTLPSLPDPGCASLTPRTSPVFPGGVNSLTLQPGYYSGGISLSGGQKSVTFLPGIYCVDNGLVLTLKQTTGSNVFFYIKSGELRIEGSAEVVLSGGQSIPGDSAGTFNDQLIYMPFGNANRLRIAGGSGLSLSGRIYAPEKRTQNLASNPCGDENAPYKCELVGNSGTATINSQVICDTVRVKGTAELKMTYNDPNAGGGNMVFELNK